MDASSGWSIIRLVNSGLGSIGISTGRVGAALGSPVAAAVTAVFMIKKISDAEVSKLLAHVQQSEGCPHISLLEGWPPTPAALEYVYQYNGIAWRLGAFSSFFWHSERTSKPPIFDWAFVRGPSGVDLLRSAGEYNQKVIRPKDGFCCTTCRLAGKQRNA